MKLLSAPDNKNIVFPLLRTIAGVSSDAFKVFITSIISNIDSYFQRLVEVMVMYLHKEDGVEVKTPLRAVMAILSMNNTAHTEAVMAAVAAEILSSRGQ